MAYEALLWFPLFSFAASNKSLDAVECFVAINVVKVEVLNAVSNLVIVRCVNRNILSC